jgi:hypothetical protein
MHKEKSVTRRIAERSFFVGLFIIYYSIEWCRRRALLLHHFRRLFRFCFPLTTFIVRLPTWFFPATAPKRAPQSRDLHIRPPSHNPQKPGMRISSIECNWRRALRLHCFRRLFGFGFPLTTFLVELPTLVLSGHRAEMCSEKQRVARKAPLSQSPKTGDYDKGALRSTL